MRTILSTVLAVALLLCPAAFAADMSMFVKAPPKPVAAPWTGFYGGFHVGYGWGEKKFIDNFPVFDGEVDAEVRPSGALAGFQLGYNYQIDWLMLGLEGDFSWSDIKKDSFSCFTFGDQLCSAKPQWFADVSGRLGLPYGTWLFYAKGGAAWVQDHFDNVATCSGSQPIAVGGVSAACGVQFFGDQTRFGWLVGGGVESYFAPNWSWKLEYNYMDFGGRSVTFKDAGDNVFTEEIHQSIQTVKAGLNYHFGAPAAPVSYPGIFKAAPRGASASQSVGFTGTDISKYSYSGWGGAIIAPFGNLDSSGFRIFMLGEGGWYKYPAGGQFIRGTTTGGDLLAGYAFEGDNYSLGIYAGGNAASHTLSAVDQENPVQGTQFGGKARVDLTINPTPATLIYGEGEYATAFGTYYATTKLGYEVIKGSAMFFGPEASVMGDLRYDQWRVGGHLTQIKIGSVEIAISSGYAHDSSVGVGAYGHLEISRPF